MKSDNKTKVSVVLASSELKGLSVEVRDVKFGLKKYVFEVSVHGGSEGGEPQTVSLAAASENEKRAWMNAIEFAAGLPLSGAAVTPSTRKSGRLSMNKIKDDPPSSTSSSSKRGSSRIGFGSFSGKKTFDKTSATPSNNNNSKTKKGTNDSRPSVSSPTEAGSTAQILGLLTGGATSGKSDVRGGARALSVAESEAQRKLRLKLAGKISIPVFKQSKCGVCEKTVYKTEEILVDNKPYHKRSCFRCNKCKRQLTLGNFAAVNKQLYCKTHYKEMFHEAGGRYEVFGDAGFKHTSTSAAHREIAARAQSVNVTNMPSLRALAEEESAAVAKSSTNSKPAVAQVVSNKSSKKEKEPEQEKEEDKAMTPSQIFAAERTKRQSAKKMAATNKDGESDESEKKDDKKRSSRARASSSSKHKSKRREEKERRRSSRAASRSHKRSSAVNEEEEEEEEEADAPNSDSDSEDEGRGNLSELDLALGNIVKERKASSISRRRDSSNARHSTPSRKTSRRDRTSSRMRSTSNNSEKDRSESSVSAIGRRKDKKKNKKKDRSESSASRKESSRSRKESSRSSRASRDRGASSFDATEEEEEEDEALMSMEEFEEYDNDSDSDSGSDVETIEEEEEEEKDINLSKRKSGGKKSSADKSSENKKTGEGKLSNAAVMDRPSGPTKTRKKKVEKVGKALNKIADKEKKTHERTFVLRHAQNGVLMICHCSSLAEFDRWTRILSNAVEICVLEDLLKVAQKKNMIESLQAQMVLEAFRGSSELECNGFMERQRTKKKKGKWKKRYFVLQNGSLTIKGSEKKKKAETVFELDGDCRVTDGAGHEIRPEIPEAQAMDGLM